jgi:deazaflavin-dependent oxidoreductase (nitroreductase family)
MRSVILIVVVLVLAVPAAFFFGMRGKWPFVLDAVRAMNKRFLNPRQMRSAGTPGAYAAVIHHTGRSSGRTYATPVGVVRIDDDFLIALPYGTRPDWVRNVLKAGSAEIDLEGAHHSVERPEVVSANTMMDRFPESDRRAQRMFAVDQVMRLHTAVRA